MRYLANIEYRGEAENIVIHNLPSAPSSPIEGQVYQNTENHTMYYYNGTLWIPLRDKLTFQLSGGINNVTKSNQDFKRQDGIPTSDTPYIAAFNCALVAMSAGTSRLGNNESWAVEILKNDSTEASLEIVNNIKGYSNSYNNTFAAGDEIRFKLIIGSTKKLSYPAVTAWFREI